MRTATLFVAVFLCGCSQQAEKAAAPAAKDSGPGVKITQFYSNPPSVAKGGKALLCYGVEGAASVRVEPPVEQLSPALTRCFDVVPEKTSTYTLIAEGRGGGSAKASVTLTVGGAPPTLFDLAINKTSAKAGDLVSFCFQAKNATSVRGGPGRFQRGGLASKDCLVDQPTKTTTYKIVVSNAEGLSDQASMTVQVHP